MGAEAEVSLLMRMYKVDKKKTTVTKATGQHEKCCASCVRLILMQGNILIRSDLLRVYSQKQGFVD